MITKRQLVADWVEKMLKRAAGNTLLEEPKWREEIAWIVNRLRSGIQYHAIDIYAFLELEDVMKWRKRKVGE